MHKLVIYIGLQKVISPCSMFISSVSQAVWWYYPDSTGLSPCSGDASQEMTVSRGLIGEPERQGCSYCWSAMLVIRGACSHFGLYEAAGQPLRGHVTYLHTQVLNKAFKSKY